ncbi:MAG: ATP-binding protein [Candidatus Sungbacteria bacterium]|nr:ATP-binding protein [bacterium]MDZ4260385.1 ATP-binding protein [Candidatus Sungbacteria bacterium]
MTIPPLMRTIGVLSGIAVIPLILCTGFLLTQSLKAQYRNAETLAHEQTENAAQELSAVLLARILAVDYLGSSYFESLSDHRARERSIDSFISSRDDMNDIIITDGKGKELIHRSRNVSEINTLGDRSENIEFISIKEKGFYFGPLYVSQGRTVFLIGRAIPKSENQGMRGAIFVLLNGSILQAVLKDTASQQGGSVFIVNDKGTLVAHSSTSYIVEGRDFSHNFALRLAMGGQLLPVKTYHNEFDQKVVGSGAPLRISLFSHDDITPNWYVLTETPASLAYASVFHQRSIALITMSIFLVIAGLGAFFVWRYMVSPMEALQSAQDQLNQGNLAYRMQATSDDRWGMAVGFNAIADKMKQMSGELDEERNTIILERNKLKLALSGITDAVIACDAKGTIMLTNKIAEDLIGFAISTVMGKHIDEVVRLYENDKQISLNDCFSSAHENGFAVVGGINGLRMIIGENHERMVCTKIGTLPRESSHQGGYLLTFHDVTHERFLEKVKADFVAIAAHQLRTPLSEVKWSMDVLMGNDLGTLSRKQKNFLKRSYESNERMIRLVDDLLETAKIEEQQTGYDKAPHDITKLIEDVLAVQKKKAEKRGLVITVKKQRGKIPLVPIDDMAVKIVFNNMIENAIHYTPKGGAITVSITKKDAAVGVSIMDTGIGVLPEDQEYLFTKFFRGKNAVRTQTDGTGLGLYVSKKIIDAHGGSMWMNSELDRGSTFGFDIPLQV